VKPSTKTSRTGFEGVRSDYGGDNGRRKRLPHQDFRNEANFWGRLLIRLGRGGFGRGGCGPQVLELLQGAVVVAVNGIDAALETIEYLVAKKEDPALGVLI
jgi:hypothetical protein